MLTGASPRAIAADWNKQGITTTRGNGWSKETVKQVLRNPRICGYRSKKVREFNPEAGTESVRVEPVLDDDGEPVKGQWDPIISVADWEAVTEVIGKSPEPGDAYNARKYLGTGTLRCDKNGCGGRLRAMKAPASRNKPEGFFYYTCPDKRSGYGCGGIRISGPETDRALKMLVIAKYEEEAQEREATSVPEEWGSEEELAAVQNGESHLIAGFCDDDIIIWDAANGEVYRRLKGHTQDVLAICSIQVGQRVMLASSGLDNSVRLWGPNGAIGHTLSELSNGVYSAQEFSLLSRPAILACEYNGAIRLRSAKTGKTVRLVQGQSQGALSVLSTRVSDQQVVMTGGFDGIVRMRDPLKLGNFEPVFQLHAAPVVSICSFRAHDWSLVASADKNGHIYVWDPISREFVLSIEDWHEEVYDVCSFSRDGETFIACAGHSSSDAPLIVIDPLTGEIARRLPAQHDWAACVEGFQVGRNSFVVTGGADGVVRTWDPVSGSIVSSIDGHTDSITAITVFNYRNRSFVASGGNDRTVRLWDPLKSTRIMDIPVYHPVTSISRVGSSIVVGSGAGVLSLSINLQWQKNVL
ncbi:recombinase family protein [Streptomyces sp. NPDC056165]|uniref:recombinase family protein n=1 Tax=Streptomyces sp. NPDC056165 TaxID=3345733 RepID=UPI0035DF791F